MDTGRSSALDSFVHLSIFITSFSIPRPHDIDVFIHRASSWNGAAFTAPDAAPSVVGVYYVPIS